MCRMDRAGSDSVVKSVGRNGDNGVFKMPLVLDQLSN